jgi:enterochelin esterase-like enzyme
VKEPLLGAPADYPASVNVAVAHAPKIDAGGVTFSLPDPDRALVAVRLHQEIVRPRAGPDFERDSDGTWLLRMARPEADRMEYKIELVHKDGATEIICDPANALRAPGPFGDKSALEWPEYRAPAWIDDRSNDSGHRVEASLSSRALKAELRVLWWTSPGAAPDEALPLLVAHDGPEYDEFSQLTRAMAVAVRDGRVPPFRAALLAPVDRDQTYSASAAYARALNHELLPSLYESVPTRPGRVFRVGMGASLGALAMLHAHRTNPAGFGALFLQSGSYFRQRFDRQESGFVRFRRISRFVGRVMSDQSWVHPIPVAMTCGTAEENLHNNSAVYEALRDQGYEVKLHKNRDAHNWTAWRDTFDPHLIDFLAGMWS